METAPNPSTISCSKSGKAGKAGLYKSGCAMPDKGYDNGATATRTRTGNLDEQTDTTKK